MDEFEKIAQRRSVWNKVRPSNVTRQISKLNPEYREQYNRLTEADDYIRNIRGPEDETPKDLLKDLKKNVKNYRWIAVLDTAAKANELAKMIHNNSYVQDLIDNMKNTVQDFYFTNEDSKGRSIDLSRIEGLVNASEDVELVKQALLGNFSRRLTNKFLENFQDKDAKKVRLAVNNIANKTQTLLNRVINVYDALDVARAKGSISSYIDNILALKKEQESFEVVYKNTYNAIKPYLPKQEEVVQNIDEDDSGDDEEQIYENVVQPDRHTPAFKFGPGGLKPDESGEVGFTQIIDDEHENIPDEAVEIITNEKKPKALSDDAIRLRNLAREIEDSYKSDEENKLLGLDSFKNKGLVEGSKLAIKERKYAIAAVLLSQYSQELENAGNMFESAKMLALAEELDNAK